MEPGKSELASRVLAGDAGAAARACRLVDERAPGHRELSAELFPHAGRARLIGVTGAPGAGKSTLLDALIAELRRRGERVGVVAVDPSSPWSGGALLGDRVRMQRHALDPGVFVRSLATRGALGGLSRSSEDVARVLATWGAESVLLETVGVGQAELDVLGVADTVVVVVTPGTGDAIQAGKAGILEVADVLALNKADTAGADAAEHDLAQSLALSAAPWTPPIVRTIAPSAGGVAELLAAVEAHRAWLFESEPGRRRRVERARYRLAALARELLLEETPEPAAERLDALVDAVLRRELEPRAAAERLIG